MAHVEVTQLNSKGRGFSFLNVEEGYGFVSASGFAFDRETYLMTIGLRFHLVQFDKDVPQEEIKKYFEKFSDWNVVKIEKDSFVVGAK